MIPDEIIEQVRDAADIVQVIGEHVELRRTGSDYRGPCPFHGGTHRNLAVIPKKQMFYCFVCHEAGDVFTFHMKTSGMDYPTAVREVARKSGIVIPERSTGGPDPREPFYSAVGVAAEWYARQLRESKEARPAREHLESRRFDLEALHPLGLGYAPKGSAFRDAMLRLGFQDEVLLEAGLLVKRDDGSLRPRFWDRLLFSISDLRGRAVGFGGRILGAGEPKYLNSPETPIFHKGRLLYNLHNAKHAIRKAEQAIIVEGYFDVLRLIEVGVEHVVAPLGTALTPDQAQLVKRFTTNATLLYDNDTAGLRATFRTGDELLRASLRVLVATLPPGEDPDTLCRTGGAQAARTVLDDAMDLLERKLQLLERKGWLASLAGRRRALDRLLPTLRAARDPVTRDLYVSRVAERLGVSPASVSKEMQEAFGGGAQRTRQVPAEEASGPSPRVGRGGPERDLLRVMLNAPEWRSRIAEQIGDPSWLHEPERSLVTEFAAAPPELAGPDLLAHVQGEARTLVTELLRQGWGEFDVDALVTGAINKLDSRPLEAELRDLDRRLPFASADEKPELARQKVELRERITKLNPGRWPVIQRGRTSGR